MAIFVTGSAGYIGGHTVWQFVDSGETVVVLDNLATRLTWASGVQATRLPSLPTRG